MSQGETKSLIFLFELYIYIFWIIFFKNNNYLFKNSWQFVVHNYVIMWNFFFIFTFSFYYLSFLRFIIKLYFCYSFYGEKINQNMSVKFDILILHKNLMEYVWKQFKIDIFSLFSYSFMCAMSCIISMYFRTEFWCWQFSMGIVKKKFYIHGGVYRGWLM